jgi:hypothetical protein
VYLHGAQTDIGPWGSRLAERVVYRWGRKRRSFAYSQGA